MKKLLLSLLLTTMMVLLAACPSSDNQKPAPLIAFKPKIQVQKLWGQHTGYNAKAYANLQIGHDQKALYTADFNGTVYANSLLSGNKIWRKRLHANIVSGVSVNDKLTIIADGNGQVIALNTADGAIRWQQNVGNQVLALAAIANGVVVVKTVADKVITLSAKNGSLLWHFDGNAPTLILRGGSQAKIVGNKVIVGFADGKLRAFDLYKGSLLWEQIIAQPEGGFEVERMVDITASFQESDGVVYVVSYQGNLAALAVDSGRILWRHKLSSYTGLTVGNGYLYVTDAQSHVYCFAIQDGTNIWQQTTLQARNITAPVLFEKYVIVADAQGYIHWLAQKDGQFVARQQLSSAVIRSALVALGKRLYVLDTHGHLAAYTLANQ